jgi:hypothetical protein
MVPAGLGAVGINTSQSAGSSVSSSAASLDVQGNTLRNFQEPRQCKPGETIPPLIFNLDSTPLFQLSKRRCSPKPLQEDNKRRRLSSTEESYGSSSRLAI